MTEQLAMFETDAERRAREVDEKHAAWLAARAETFARIAVPGGYQCPTCGNVERAEWLLDSNHGHPNGYYPWGTWCWKLYLRTNHALYALSTGDLALWVQATADLRQIAAWRRSR